MISAIYMIEHTVSGRCYIGSTVDVRKRFRVHRRELNAGVHANRSLLNAWNKYGERAFEFRIIERCPVGCLLEYEQQWLDLLQPFNRRGYNLSKVAGAPMAGCTHSEKTKRRMSRSRKGQRPHQNNIEANRRKWAGRKHTVESRRKMRESAHRRWSDPAQRELARQKSTGNTNKRDFLARQNGVDHEHSNSQAVTG